MLYYCWVDSKNFFEAESEGILVLLKQPYESIFLISLAVSRPIWTVRFGHRWSRGITSKPSVVSSCACSISAEARVQMGMTSAVV